VRIRSDQILKHIISPAAQECDYEAIRADHISEPGIITAQVIQHIVNDPLVIADLTGHNPNVFYELSLRHTLKRPVVQIIDAADTIPFDVATSRIIQVDHHDLDSVAQAKEEIVRQIRAVEKNPNDVDTPISVAIDLQLLRQSDNPVEKSNAEIITMLQDLRKGVLEIRDALDARVSGIEQLVRNSMIAGYYRPTVASVPKNFESSGISPEAGVFISGSSLAGSDTMKQVEELNKVMKHIQNAEQEKVNRNKRRCDH
jgi:hypothetical protein